MHSSTRGAEALLEGFRMNHGLYLSAAGTLTALHRQDVQANNLANVQTIGFKADTVLQRERLPEHVEAGLLPVSDTQAMLEQLGGGTLLAPTTIVLDQGPLEHTAAPFDVAIEGEGFFVVGAGGEKLLTRDGRFTRSGSGHLALAAGGQPVLDVQGRPIPLDPNGRIDIDGRGAILQNGAEIARLALVDAEPGELRKQGHNLLRFTVQGREPEPAEGTLRQGFIEQSAVDPIMTLNRMMTAARAAQASARLMQYHDFIMSQAIGTFGRVA